MTTKRKKEPIEIILKPITDFLHRKPSGRFILSRFLTFIKLGAHTDKNQIMEQKIRCGQKIFLKDNVV